MRVCNWSSQWVSEAVLLQLMHTLRSGARSLQCLCKCAAGEQKDDEAVAQQVVHRCRITFTTGSLKVLIADEEGVK